MRNEKNFAVVNFDNVVARTISHADLVKAVNMNKLYLDISAPTETTAAIQTIIDWASAIIECRPEVLHKITVDWELKKERVYLKRDGKVFFKARANKNDIVICIPGKSELGSHGAFGECAARVDWATAAALLTESIG